MDVRASISQSSVNQFGVARTRLSLTLSTRSHAHFPSLLHHFSFPLPHTLSHSLSHSPSVTFPLCAARAPGIARPVKCSADNWKINSIYLWWTKALTRFTPPPSTILMQLPVPYHRSGRCACRACKMPSIRKIFNWRGNCEWNWRYERHFKAANGQIW